MSAGKSENVRFAQAALLTAAINTPIVFVSASAREARLFALPLVFLWPFLGAYALHAWQSARTHCRHLFHRMGAAKRIIYLFSIAMAFFAVVKAVNAYTPTASGYFDIGYRVYLALILSSAALAGISFILRPRVKP